MSWFLLLVAGLLEIGWAIGLKYTDGFTRLWPSVATLATAWLSFYLLALAVREIPIGTAYAIWTGIGAVGVATFGILFLKEPASMVRILFILMIVAGIMGLKLFSTPH